jgi:hypothetical protein
VPPPRDLGSLDEKLWYKKYTESDLKPLKEEEWRHRDDFKGGTVLIVVVVVLLFRYQGRGVETIGSGVSRVFVVWIYIIGFSFFCLLFGFSFFCYTNLSVIGFQVSGDRDIRCVFIECVLD